jgi:hypothetical protein
VSSSDDWAAFLDAYYGAGDAIPVEEQATFTDPDTGPEVVFEDDGSVTLNGAFDPAGLDNITEATISYALVNDDDSITYFGEEIADFEVGDDGIPVASGNYDLTYMEISDGEDSAYAYVDLDLSDDLATAFFDVPMTYYASTDPETPQDALLSLVLNIDAGEFESETIYIYDEESGGYGELAPDPEGILVPDVLTIDTAGEQVWEPTTDVGLYSDIANLTYDFAPLDPGTVLQVDLTIYDFGGNASTLSSYVEAP